MSWIWIDVGEHLLLFVHQKICRSLLLKYRFPITSLYVMLTSHVQPIEGEFPLDLMIQCTGYSIAIQIQSSNPFVSKVIFYNSPLCLRWPETRFIIQLQYHTK